MSYTLLIKDLESIHEVVMTAEPAGSKEWEQMAKQDQRLRSQFKKIKNGMTSTEVRSLMGLEPLKVFSHLWRFKLSPASDTATEKNHVLLITFEEDKVSKAETSCDRIDAAPQEP